jgi:hypothetical protein
MPSLLLDWNANDPVSDLEMTRNDIIHSFQGNRNPFIDNPFLATLIYGGTPANDTWNTFSVESSSKKTFSVYPTIADDFIFVQSDFSGRLRYVIYDMIGKRVSTGFTKSGSINVSFLSSEVYMLRLTSISAKVSSSYRFVKN